MKDWKFQKKFNKIDSLSNQIDLFVDFFQKTVKIVKLGIISDWIHSNFKEITKLSINITISNVKFIELNSVNKFSQLETSELSI